jgi:hypothetical protein
VKLRNQSPNLRHDRDGRKDIKHVVIGWVINWENLVATSIVVFRHSSLGYTVHVKLVSARTIETGEIIRGDIFMFSTVARYISTASCFLATEMIPPLGFFWCF